MSDHPPITIVDEEDNVVGEASMQEMLDKGLIHRIARVMVEDQERNILLQKRVDDSWVYAGCWDNSAAGHVDAGEEYEQAAVRELAEEIGIKGVELKKLGHYYHQVTIQDMLLKRFSKVYRVVVPYDTQFKIDPEEVSEVRWFSLSEAKKLAAEHPDRVTDGIIDTFKRFY